MEKSSVKLEYKVGIFIAVGLFTLIFSILIFGGNKMFFTKYMDVRARFTEVQGLFPGSVVSLAGLPVGNVKQISFVPSENKLEVTLTIDRIYQDRLAVGTVAEIRTQGALGDRYVYLSPGPPEAPRLKSGALVETIESDLLKMLTSREDGVARVIDLIKEMHILIASLNQNGQTAVVVKNMAEASQKFKSTLGQLDALIGDLRSEMPENKKVRQAILSLSSILEKVDQGKGTLGQLINDPSVHQSLKSFLGGSPRNRYMKDMIRETLQQSEATK